MEEKQETVKLEDFTHSGVMTYIHNLGIGALADTDMISRKLGVISTRSIRRHISTGALKPIDMKRPYVIQDSELANFLLEHPIYLRKNERYSDLVPMTEERYIELSKHIRNMVNAKFRPILSRMDMDDVVSEVIMYIMRTDTGHCGDTTLIFRALVKLLVKEMKRPVTLSYDDTLNNNTRNEDSNNED